MKNTVARIEPLTSLRFFAALLVVVFHHGQSAFAGAPAWFLNIIKGGYAGVPFFFILSGFILAYNYSSRAQHGTFAAREFWLARFARIYPVYGVSLVVAAPLFLMAMWPAQSPEAAVGQSLLHLVTHGALLQSWIPAWSFHWNGPAWSLSVEAFFYLLFPFLMTRLSRRGRWWALGLCAVAGCFAIGLRKLAPSLDAVGAAQRFLGWANPLLWLPLFLLGLCTGERHIREGGAGESRHSRAAANSALALVLATLILSLMAANLHRLSQLLYCYALSAPCALLIYFVARDKGWLAALLTTRPLVLLGEASYSLYVLHRPAHDWFAWMEANWNVPATTSPRGFVIYLAVCLTLSVLALKAIEYPCRKWIKNRVWDHQSGGEQMPKLSTLKETAWTQ